MLITITFLPNLVGKYNQLFPICANFSVFIYAKTSVSA